MKNGISNRVLTVLAGILISVLSIVLAINVGAVARILAFPFLFLFGITSYIVFAYLYIQGNVLIFKGKFYKIKTWQVAIGIILSLIAISTLASFITSFGEELDFGKSFESFFNGFGDNYLTTKFFNMFGKNQIGGGLFGFLLSQLTNLVGGFFTIIISTLLLLLGIFLIIQKPLFNLIHKKNNKNREESEYYDLVDSKQIKNKIKNESKTANKRHVPQHLAVKEESIQENVAHEEHLEAKEEERIETPVITPIPQPRGTFVKASLKERSKLAANTHYDVPGEFSPARIGKTNEYKFSLNKQTPHIQEINVAPRHEQLNLFEDEEEQNSLSVEEETSYIAPEVSEPVISTNRPVEINKIDIETKPIANITKEQNDMVKKENVQLTTNDKPKERVKWRPPSSNLLNTVEVAEAIEKNNALAEERKVRINEIFASFGIGASCESYVVGPSVTRYNIGYAPNVSYRNVEKMIEDIAIRIGGVAARFETVVAGSCYSGLELPNAEITTVSFKELFEQLPDVKKHPLAVGFGKDIGGKVVSADFDEFTHLLVAGTTGSGKSIYIHSVIATLIMRVSPDDLKIALVDPKQVEMTKYRDMPHLLCPIITEASKAKVMLSKLVDEMNKRYSYFNDADGASNIKQYNEWAEENGKEKIPYIIAVLDEYADLVDTCKEISQPVVSIAQKARAAGIHLLISTQRPSTNVITGVIKGNLPTHVALMTSSSTDSVTILGEGGAEKLLGKGDMLVQSPLVSRVGMVRLQGCFVQNKEIVRIVGYLKEHYKTYYDPEYLDLVDHAKEEGAISVRSGEYVQNGNNEEAKYQSIKEFVMGNDMISMSKIQANCGIGFTRAAKIMKRLQEEGVVATSTDNPSRGYRVLIHDKFSESEEYNDVTSSEQSHYK